MFKVTPEKLEEYKKLILKKETLTFISTGDKSSDAYIYLGGNQIIGIQAINISLSIDSYLPLISMKFPFIRLYNNNEDEIFSKAFTKNTFSLIIPDTINTELIDIGTVYDNKQHAILFIDDYAISFVKEVNIDVNINNKQDVYFRLGDNFDHTELQKSIPWVKITQEP